MGVLYMASYHVSMSPELPIAHMHSVVLLWFLLDISLHEGQRTLVQIEDYHVEYSTVQYRTQLFKSRVVTQH